MHRIAVRAAATAARTGVPGRGGAVDIGYHLTVIPLLLLTLVVVQRRRS